MKYLVTSFLICILLITATACNNTNDDITDKFNNSIFIGDSITYGLSFNEILPEEQVMAGAGATAGYIYEEYMDKISEMNPDNIFIMLGSIDLLMPVDDPKELFRNNLTKLINSIKLVHPNVEIYIQSITPVTQEALQQEPRYEFIDEYNILLRELADELSVNYVDVSILVHENPHLFAEDGVHYKVEFYQLWLDKLLDLI